VQGAGRALGELNTRVDHLKAALTDTPAAGPAQRQRLDAIEARLDDLAIVLNGDPVRAGANEPRPMSLSGRVGNFQWAQWNALAAVTDNQKQSLEIARAQFTEVRDGLQRAEHELSALEAELAGEAPWTPGRIPELEN